MSIRLLALDLDGTLLNSKGELSQGNRRAIARAREKGVRVALATGRRFRDVRPLALELDLDVPVIAHNGALTKHALSLEVVEVRLLPREAARKIIRLGRDMNMDALVSDEPHGAGILVYDRLSRGNRSLARYVAWSQRVHGDDVDEVVRMVASLEEFIDHDPIHIAFSGACSEMERLRVYLQESMGSAVKIFSTLYPRQDFALVDVLHPEASKGFGVAAAAFEQGLGREEVMAIGDNLNDLEMLDFARTSVIMGNAESGLRSMERFHITASNDEDGVAQAIDKFILM